MRCPIITTFLLSAALLFSTSAAHAAVMEPFTVEVALSQNALAKLSSLKESVTVSAVYAARPNEAGKKVAVRNVIDLGEDSLTYTPVPRKKFSITGKSFKLAALRYVQPGSASVLVNVFSARKAYADNLLDCDVFDGSFSQAVAAQPIQLSCTLIGE